MRRWLLATIGILSCGFGLLGVFVPGLPTTIFVIIASYCFTRSCPWLEDRLLRNRLFARSMRYVDGDLELTAAHRIVISGVIVLFTGSSIALLSWSGKVGGAWLVAIALFGLAGVFAVSIWRRSSVRASEVGRDAPRGSAGSGLPAQS